MNMNPAETLYRLHGLLPLKERQQDLSTAETELHRAILHSFITQGRPLNRIEISNMWGGSDCDVLLAHLRDKDLLVLDKQGSISGAYPFTTENTPHCLKVNGHRVHAMCALDALAVSPLFGLEVQIDSRCAVSHAAIHIHQRDQELLEVTPSNDLLLGIHWQQTSGCAAHSLCREMVFLENLEAAMTWQGLAPETRELYELQEAVKLAADFFKPLLHDET